MLAVLVLALLVVAALAVIAVERRCARLAGAAEREAGRIRRRLDAQRTALADVQRAADRALDPPATSS